MFAARFLFTMAGIVVVPSGNLHANAVAAFDSAPVADTELATYYGKFIAPGGIDLAMAVQSDTAVDGQLVLRSIFTADNGPPSLQVFAPLPGMSGPGLQSAAGSGDAQSSPQNQSVSIMVDRAGANSAIVPLSTGSTLSPHVMIAKAEQAAPLAPDNAGLAPVAVIPGRSATQTGAGAVSAADTYGGTRVTLDGAGLSVSHLMGGATGSFIVNTANNRVIDTVTTVAVNIRNAEVLSTSSAMLRIDGIATLAAQTMGR